MPSVIRLNVMAPTANLRREIIGIDSKRKKKTFADGSVPGCCNITPNNIGPKVNGF